MWILTQLLLYYWGRSSIYQIFLSEINVYVVAKTIQCVGNLGLQIGLGKEQYLEPLYPFIRASVKGIRGHLDHLCDIDQSKGRTYSSLAVTNLFFGRFQVLHILPTMSFLGLKLSPL